MSKAHVFDINVLNFKQVLCPRRKEKASRHRPSSHLKHMHTKHRDAISWQLRPFVPINGYFAQPLDRNLKKISRCACGIALPVDMPRLVRHNMHVAAASTRVFASSTGVGSVWGPLLPQFTASKHMEVENANDPWCWVSQNKVMQPYMPTHFVGPK